MSRANTYSWPRSSRQGSGKTSPGKDLKESRRFTHSNTEIPCREGESDSITLTELHTQTDPTQSGLYRKKKKSPSISIEPESNLELDLTVSQMAVETNDTLTARAFGSNDTREGVIVHSDDESIDGDVAPIEGGKEVMQEEEEGTTQLHEGEEQVDEKEGATADQPSEQVSHRCSQLVYTSTLLSLPLPPSPPLSLSLSSLSLLPLSQQLLELSDSQHMLEQFMVKNLDTGEQFPLSAAEERIPRGINPIYSHCQERSKGQFVDDEPDADQDSVDLSQRRKPHGK